jgi:3-oxoacyl-[acyl-carrier-protein] synthase II
MAIAAARRQLLSGQCDLALAGGADGFSVLAFVGFMRLRVMAAEVCRPFDERRDGLLVGEGAAMFVLERETSARRRGAPIRALIAGSGFSCETYHPTRADPTAQGMADAIAMALREAGLSAGEIDYVCAHGTGTSHNDATELEALRRMFPSGPPASSIKGVTGHTMGAAAAIEAAACVLSLENQVVIPTWNLEQPMAGGEHLVRGSVRPARLRHVLNNAAGFGGYNASLVLTGGPAL